MSQFIQPDGNITQTSFTNGYSEINESVVSDLEFAYGANNTVSTLEVSLGNLAGTPIAGTTTVRYRVGLVNSGVLDDGTGSPCDITCYVYQGSTLIASDVARTATNSWTTYSFTPDMSGVTDWSDLRLRFITTASGSTNPTGAAISWSEVEVPDFIPSKIIIAVLAGQSNMEGRVLREAQDRNVPGIYQFEGFNGRDTYRTIQGDITPLWHVRGYTDAGGADDRVGPGEYLSRELLTDNPSGTAVILVPVAEGSTALISGPSPLWCAGNPGGNLFENMVSQSNLAYSAAQSKWSGVPIEVQIYWIQGEQDSNNACDYQTYLDAMENLIATARTRITGASSSPFIIGSMIPQLWKIGNPAYQAAYATVNRAHVATSLNIANTYYVVGPYPGSSSDGLHYSPVSFTREMGLRLSSSLVDVVGPTMTSAASITVSQGNQLSLLLSASEQHQTFHIVGGVNASEFEISDPYITPTLRWVGDGSSPANGSYSVDIAARDGSGNYGPTQTVVVTVSNEVSPNSFFSLGERGMAWDLSNLDNLFQDIDGTIPVTAAGQVVGKIVDVSGNSNHWVAASNNSSRPTYQVDTDGKPYLQFDGSNDVLLAATPFVNGATSIAFTAIIGMFGAAQSATKTLLSTNSTTMKQPFVCPLQSIGTTTSITPIARNDASSQLSPTPSIVALDSAKHVVTSTANGNNQPASMRDAALRPADGGGGNYTTTGVGSVCNLPVSVTRAGLGANCAATPGNFFNGRIYSGLVINRLLSDNEIKGGEEWVANRSLSTALPGQTVAAIYGGSSHLEVSSSLSSDATLISSVTATVWDVDATFSSDSSINGLATVVIPNTASLSGNSATSANTLSVVPFSAENTSQSSIGASALLLSQNSISSELAGNSQVIAAVRVTQIIEAALTSNATANTVITNISAANVILGATSSTTATVTDFISVESSLTSQSSLNVVGGTIIHLGIVATSASQVAANVETVIPVGLAANSAADIDATIGIVGAPSTYEATAVLTCASQLSGTTTSISVIGVNAQSDGNLQATAQNIIVVGLNAASNSASSATVDKFIHLGLNAAGSTTLNSAVTAIQLATARLSGDGLFTPSLDGVKPTGMAGASTSACDADVTNLIAIEAVFAGACVINANEAVLLEATSIQNATSLVGTDALDYRPAKANLGNSSTLNAEIVADLLCGVLMTGTSVTKADGFRIRQRRPLRQVRWL